MEAVRWWAAPDEGVGPAVVVVVKEPVEHPAPSPVGTFGADRDTLTGNGLVDLLDLPVGTSPFGPDAHVSDAEVREEATEDDCVGVVGCVVGHHGPDFDAVDDENAWVRSWKPAQIGRVSSERISG